MSDNNRMEKSWQFQIQDSQEKKTGIIYFDIKVNFDVARLELLKEDPSRTESLAYAKLIDDQLDFYADLQVRLRQLVEKKYKEAGYKVGSDIKEKQDGN